MRKIFIMAILLLPLSAIAEDKANNEKYANVKKSCITIISNSLKAPATAKYSHFYFVAISEGQNTYSVMVDAQNSYGALLRHEYVCVTPIGSDKITKVFDFTTRDLIYGY